MLAYEEIEKDELKDLLNANWMTHDATWFASCMQEIGIEKTNLINKKAVNEMAKMEARRLKKLLGIKKISNMEELKRFFETGFAIIKGTFMKFEMEFDEKNNLIWKIPKCFAYEGVKRLGTIDKYECGIVERVFGWLEVLDVGYTITPKPNGCNMHNFGRCEMEMKLQIKGDNQ